MTKTLARAADPAIMTVGDLIGELCRWPDHAAVTFRCPYLQQDLQFYRLQARSKATVEIQLKQDSESPPVEPT